MLRFSVQGPRDRASIGNGVEAIHSLYKNILVFGLQDEVIEVYYKHDYQKQLLQCIPILKEESLIKIEGETPYFEPFGYGYYLGWEILKEPPVIKLVIPDTFEPKFSVPEKSISIHARESSYDSGWGKQHQPERFVNIEPFHKLALYYADNGYKVYQIGDHNMTPFPEHENIIRVSHIENKTILDDCYAIANSQVCLATDSGMWVCSVCFGTKTILSNSCHPIDKWWPDEKLGHITLNKKLIEEGTGRILSNEEIIDKWGPKRFFERDGYKLVDNSYDELKDAVERALR